MAAASRDRALFGNLQRPILGWVHLRLGADDMLGEVCCPIHIEVECRLVYAASAAINKECNGNDMRGLAR